MKLTCESCQAKYAIADEKIAGRNFKIRCKRCGAALVVRGEGVTPSASAPVGEWYVLAGDRQEGPFDRAELRARIASGVIDGETYVWKDGLEDWRALREVGKLASLLPSEADLFGGAPEPSPFAASEPAPGEAAPSEALTGTRNESSVLFSLSNLSALGAPPAPSASPAKPAASGDGSGLIDIRALAAAAQPKPALAPVDDLLSLGSAASLASPLGAPVIAPAPERSSRSALIAIVGAASVVVAAATVVVVVLLAQTGNEARADTPPAAAIEPAREAIEPAPAATEPAPAIEPARGAIEPAPAAAEDVEVALTERAPVARTEERAPRRSPHAQQTAPRPASPDEPARAEREQPARAPRGERSITQLIDESLDPRDEEPRPREAERLPAAPSRSDVVGAMSRVAGAVRACGNGTRGMAPVRIVFSGGTGRVSSAEVTGSSLPPDVRSCIARAVRDASVPRFGQSTFRVDYPFAL